MTVSHSVTFTNPASTGYDLFGWRLSAVGTDKVVIGAYQGASNVGAAFLLSTDGTHLTTFTNPTPDLRDFFGAAVVGLGTDRVIIGAQNEDRGTYEGAAYIFRIDGTLL